MSFVNDNLDLLQNIEFGIISVYRENNKIRDVDVQKALKILIDQTRKRINGQPSSIPDSSGIEYTIVDAVSEILKIRGDSYDELKSHIFAFKRINKSVKLWTKKRGIRGYLKFIDNFIQ